VQRVFTPLRSVRTVTNAAFRDDPGSAAHRFALRSVRGTNHSVMRGLDPRIHPSSQESFEEDGLPGQARQ
jgi:hypothetical protein